MINLLLNNLNQDPNLLNPDLNLLNQPSDNLNLLNQPLDNLNQPSDNRTLEHSECSRQLICPVDPIQHQHSPQLQLCPGTSAVARLRTKEASLEPLKKSTSRVEVNNQD